MRRVVVLPQPDGPSKGDELAFADRQIEIVDGGKGLIKYFADPHQRNNRIISVHCYYLQG
jgi:hypothetical protein